MSRNDALEVYELDSIADDPRFEGFSMEDSPSILGRESLDEDLYPEAVDDNVTWEQPHLLSRWSPPKVVGRVSEFNDFPCVDDYPAFSERAVEALQPLLEVNGELLPVKSKTKTRFFLFNVLTFSDAIDLKRSKVTFCPDISQSIEWVDHFEFDCKKVAELSIFRLRAWPSRVFVTNMFVDRVRSYGLKGFRFIKAWPLPVGVNWRMQELVFDESEPAQLKQHTLLLVLPFDGSSKQKKAISHFEDLVDQRLNVTDLKQTYQGAYEGSDHVEQQYRMFFSTPDVDSLFAFLQDDIQNLKWHQPITAYLRYGDMYDEKAEEKKSVI